MGAAAVEALIGVTEPALAVVLAPFISGFVFDTTQICGSPPPDDPGLTAQDAQDILNWGDPTISQPALAKLNQWFLSWYWYSVCHCTGAATPAAPVPSNPGSVVGINTGAPSGPSGGKCWDATQTIPLATSGYQPAFDPNVMVWNKRSSTNTNIEANLPQPLPTSLSFTVSCDGLGGNPPSDFFTKMWFYDVNGTQLQQNNSADIPVPGSVTLTNTPPAGAFFVLFQWVFNSFNPSAPATGSATAHISMYCAGQSATTPLTPCCPPDPTLELRLNQILGLLQSLWQGQATPVHSYAESTVHDGLVGNGSFLVDASTLAIKVSLTSVPTNVGVGAGTPQPYFHAGFVTPIAAEAPLAGWRLLFNPQLFALPQLTEQIGYTLESGVVATITEVVKGP